MKRHCLGLNLAGIIWMSFVSLSVVRPARAEDEYRALLLRAMAAKEQALDSHTSTDWEETLRRLRETDAIRATPESKYEIAFAEAQLGHTDLALETYELALEMGLTGTAAAKARTFANEQAPRLSQLDVYGEEGGRVIVGDVGRGQLPFKKPLFVLPGTIKVELITRDNRRVERQLSLVAGQLQTLHLDARSGNNSSVPSNDSLATQANFNAATLAPKAVAMTRPFVTERSTVSNSLKGRFDSTTGGTAWRRTGWLLLGAGTAVGALGVVFIPTSAKRLADSRQALFAACDVQLNGPDSCANAKAGRQQEAQIASNSIATWKGVRTASWVSSATGLAAAATGATLLMLSKPSTDAQPVTPRAALLPTSLEISIVGLF
jgi:hypothetical protein